MNYDLSIIISHYLPENLNTINPIIKTLDKINEQKKQFKIEIIIADDG